MKVTREQAIKIIDRATDRGAFDDWWCSVCSEVCNTPEESDEYPTLYDVLEGLGVTKEECNLAGI